MTKVTQRHTVLEFRHCSLAFALVALLGGCGDPGEAEMATEEDSIGEVSQALHCPGSDYLYINDGSAAASLWLHYNCPNGRARITGSLSDINCDHRSAWLTLRFHGDSGSRQYRVDELQNGGGCNTSITIDRNTGDNTPYVRAFVYATSGTPGQSRGADGTLNGG